MTNPINLGESHELRDSAGNLVGYFLSVEEFEARGGGLNGSASAPRDTIEQRSKELTEECERLRAELEAVRKERDGYLKSVYTLLSDHPKYNEPLTFTREDILACRGQRPTFEEVVRELEDSMGVEHA